MRTFVLLVVLGFALVAKSQSCLGNFTQATIATFDPNWVYGCATGPSCSGGTQFYNQPACEPTSPIDPCAVAPSCGSATNGSDLWFDFFASNSTVVISVIQNTSFVAAIQAFSSGTDCATLSEIGCAVAGGPSSGVVLTLNGLSIGEKYSFRVYGSANNGSQRTGLFCFCGSSGMSNTPLGVSLYLEADAQGPAAELVWTAVDGIGVDHFEIERCTDATSFVSVASMEAIQTSSVEEYQFLDANASVGANYYRLKAVDANGEVEYSNVVEVIVEPTKTFEIIGNPTHDLLQVEAHEAFLGEILNMHGAILYSQAIQVGRNEIDLQSYLPGVYFLKNETNGAVSKFVVLR